MQGIRLESKKESKLNVERKLKRKERKQTSK